jgi:hypothetical protein
VYNTATERLTERVYNALNPYPTDAIIVALPANYILKVK